MTIDTAHLSKQGETKDDETPIERNSKNGIWKNHNISFSNTRYHYIKTNPTQHTNDHNKTS